MACQHSNAGSEGELKLRPVGGIDGGQIGGGKGRLAFEAGAVEDFGKCAFETGEVDEEVGPVRGLFRSLDFLANRKSDVSRRGNRGSASQDRRVYSRSKDGDGDS